MKVLPYEQFASLLAVPGLVHGFSLRDHQLELCDDRELVLARSEAGYQHYLRSLGFAPQQLVRCEQVHGNAVAWAPSSANKMGDLANSGTDAGQWIAGVDGLMTAQSGCVLGILVADCCALYLVDPIARLLALVHSGAKGTKGNIAAKAVAALAQRGAEPERLIAQLSPAIAPPYYEWDFSAQIEKQLLEAGLQRSNLHRSRANTGADLQRYYSYRVEKGTTGRMLALLGWREAT